MIGHLYAAWSHVRDRVLHEPPGERDRGSTTENVIWIAALAALALTVIGIFGPEIVSAARNVVFK